MFLSEFFKALLGVLTIKTRIFVTLVLFDTVFDTFYCIFKKWTSKKIPISVVYLLVYQEVLYVFSDDSRTSARSLKAAKEGPPLQYCVNIFVTFVF